jgi:cytochrome c biogenesis protein CcmG, thiol:disulfide interchange protein DsbE
MALFGKQKNLFNKYQLPLMIFVMIITFMWHGLGTTAEQNPIAQVGHPIPNFKLEALVGEPEIVTQEIFQGKITILEAFASYCRACSRQHALMEKVVDPNKYQLIGLDYKDNKRDGKAWLHKLGNIYRVVIFDPEGTLGKSIGIRGTPTTYIVDKKGILRFSYFGRLTDEKWNELVVPKLKELEKQAD